MNAFNETLFNDLQDSGLFEMVAKGMYPLQVPQQPADFRQPACARRRPPDGWRSLGLVLAAGLECQLISHRAIPRSRTTDLVLYGWLFDVGQSNMANAQVLGKRYFGPVDETGARKDGPRIRRRYHGADGAAPPCYGTQIYFVSDRTGHKEIWSMDPDGSNQKQITHFKSISIMPAVSPDGTKLAFTTFARGNPAIFILSTETGRRLPFYNQVASLNAHAGLHTGWEADCLLLPRPEWLRPASTSRIWTGAT